MVANRDDSMAGVGVVSVLTVNFALSVVAMARGTR
jgi:hypothetical protein